MQTSDQLRQAIDDGAVDEVRRVLSQDPGAANCIIRWVEGQENLSDPLHYISDSVFHGRMSAGPAADVARALIEAGSAVEGREGQEPPLIGATSLGCACVAEVLIEAGADIHRTALFGASALHWAAYMGLTATAALLVARGAHLEQRCTEFGATPLFWAAQGFSRHGPVRFSGQDAVARVLLEAGADAGAVNNEGATPAERAADGDSQALSDLLSESR